ncbi:MAG TPA: alpha/beta fold hydrolase [Nevskiaceae bacterium]|nr:alpha/beta fold hydrolase [Nevskiaceae bacterium]
MGDARGESVIVLHGLTRTSRAMTKIVACLQDDGFEVFNFGYPSTAYSIEKLVESHVAPLVKVVVDGGARPIHFVTHSLGGILVRQLMKVHRPAALGRVVMLGPPNRGSELVDKLGRLPVFGWINGPAGHQLGTGPDSLPNRLGPVDYPVGVIAGTRSLNGVYSWLIGGPSDGKVAVERAKVDGMADFITLPVNHTFMMNDRVVHEQTAHFLRTGAFRR